MTRESIVLLLKENFDIVYKKLSIYTINRKIGGVLYQVNSEEYRRQFSKVYKDINDAVDYFLENKSEFYKGT